jgi:hypothetical protein
MEIAMCRNEIDQAEITGYRLTPERWEFIRRDAMTRAREARAQSLRDVAHWTGAQVTSRLIDPGGGGKLRSLS